MNTKRLRTSTTSAVSLTTVLIACFAPIGESATALIDPFDENRIPAKSNLPPAINDEHKICKDRWFQKPDINDPILCRFKEYLENFDLASLKYVGLIEKHGVKWPLLETPDGNIARISKGVFIGKNRGEVKDFSEDYIVIVETVINTRAASGYIDQCNYILRQGVAHDKYQLPSFP